jgi:hypothetical protein
MSTPAPAATPAAATSSAFTPNGATHMALVEPDRIVVRGQDLCRDILGQQSFTAYFLFLLTGSSPPAQLVQAADACMVAIAEHGLQMFEGDLGQRPLLFAALLDDAREQQAGCF